MFFIWNTTAMCLLTNNRRRRRPRQFGLLRHATDFVARQQKGVDGPGFFSPSSTREHEYDAWHASTPRSENNHNNKERPCEITAVERRFCSGDVGVRWVSRGAGADRACHCAGNALEYDHLSRQATTSFYGCCKRQTTLRPNAAKCARKENPAATHASHRTRHVMWDRGVRAEPEPDWVSLHLRRE